MRLSEVYICVVMNRERSKIIKKKHFHLLVEGKIICKILSIFCALSIDGDGLVEQLNNFARTAGKLCNQKEFVLIKMQVNILSKLPQNLKVIIWLFPYRFLVYIKK